MRTPPQVAPMARGSVAGGSPKEGMSGKPTSTSARPTRERIATPFHWFRSDAYATAGRTDGAGLGSRRVAKRGHVREADFDVSQADPRENCDAVPLVQPVVGHLVAEGVQPQHRKLRLVGLGLLYREHVAVAAFEPRLDSVDP